MNIELINKICENVFPDLISMRRHIHKNPELSFQEFNTAEFIRAKLTEFGIDFQTLANTGTVATVGKGNKCIAFRADIDALPILEETNLEYASINDGVMHACGHDMHTAMLLAAAKLLKENESLLNGVVKLIFQPGEEKIPGGAIMMIEEGVLQNPKPEMVFAQHIFPSEKSGTISIESGPVLASADELYWTIRGKGSHAAQPHIGRDAILVASQLINHYQTLMTKYRNPLDSGVISVTSIHGGSATNIFPDEVKMMGTLRAYNDKWRYEMHNLLIENSRKIAELYDCSCEVEIMKGYPPLVNNPNVAELARGVAVELLGEQYALQFEPKMWAEDFAYFAQQVPACFWLLGVKPEELDEMPPLHNAKLNPDENAMVNGVKMFVATALKCLA